MASWRSQCVLSFTLALGLVLLPQAARGQDPPPATTPESAPEEGHAETAPHASESKTEWADSEKTGHPSIWGTVDYLLWWTRNPHLPLLVTSGEVTDTRPGALGQEGTVLLYGGRNVDFREKHGGRFAIGVEFDEEFPVGFDVGYFLLNARTTGFSQVSPGAPILARPFFDVVNSQNDAAVIAYPGQLQGSIRIASDSFFQGAEANGSTVLWSHEKDRITLLAGFRYLDLSETLLIDETDVGLGNLQGQGARVSDEFATQNRFYGGQIGLGGNTRYKRWTVGLLAKVGFGVTRQEVQIQGHTTLPSGQVIDAGLLALSSNSGSAERNLFAVVPEARIDLGFRITDHCQLVAGYTFLYWTRVARPGDQVDTNLNPNLIPTSQTFGTVGGPARPAAPFQDTDFWAQGLNLGLQLQILMKTLG